MNTSVYHNIKYMKIIKNLPDLKKTKADVIFSTVHKSKGMEYSAVRLNEDFAELVDLSKGSEVNDTGTIRGQDAEEINIAYVAITRSYGKLFLNKSVHDYKLYVSLREPKHQELKKNDLVEDIINEELIAYEIFKKKQLKKEKEKKKKKVQVNVAIIDDDEEPKETKVIQEEKQPERKIVFEKKKKKKPNNNRIRVMKNKRI